MEDYKKKYEHALDNFKKIKAANKDNNELVDFIEYEYPELKESEDEILRKWLIKYFDKVNDVVEVDRKKVIAWLENQGKKIDVIENFDTEFEKQVSHLIASTINKEYEYTSDFVKWTANALLNYAKHELEKQGESCYPYQPEWRKNYSDNKPKVKHSVLMLTTHGIAEGEWLGGEWCQYRWSCKIKDEDVLYWLHLSDLENLEKENGEQKLVDKCKDCNNVKGCITCTDGDQYAHITEQKPTDKVKPKKELKKIEQKSTWSEEDETKIKSIIALLKSPTLCIMDGNKGIIDEIIKYLKSIIEKEKKLTYEDIEKKLTYNDIARKLFSLEKNHIYITSVGTINETDTTIMNYYCHNNVTSEKQANKLLAINKLMNVAKYLNGDWQPDWNNEEEGKYYIQIENVSNYFNIDCTDLFNSSIAYFKSEELAKQAIEILGEKTIKLAFCTDY